MIYRDCTGREIRVGDLLQAEHFRVGEKTRWQYFLVFEFEDELRAGHPHELPHTGFGISGSFPLRFVVANPTCRIIAGYACQGRELSFEDRPRVHKPEHQADQ